MIEIRLIPENEFQRVREATIDKIHGWSCFPICAAPIRLPQ